MKTDYIELIKLVENKKNKLIKKLDKTILFKKKIYKIINKYDVLLFELYVKYINDLKE